MDFLAVEDFKQASCPLTIAMRDYHVFSMDDIDGEVIDHGVVLDIEDIPWAGRQLWAPDVAYKNGKYYLYFPLKDKTDIFRIGVAISDKPEGSFVPQSDPIKESYSIDSAVLDDGDGNFYMYFVGYGADNCSGIATTKLLNVVMNLLMTSRPYVPVW